MVQDEELKKASIAVDNAWKQLKEHSTHYNESTYDEAFARWKRLGSYRRGVGRKPNGESVGLSSSGRAQAARERQRQSAMKWEKVAGYIQQLRAEVRTHDQSKIAGYVKNLINETEIILKELTVIHAQPDAEFVVISALHEEQPVLAFIAKEELENYFLNVLDITCNLTSKEANMLVDANLKLFSGIISTKYERGEYRPYLRRGEIFPRVDVSFKDIKKTGGKLSPDILKTRNSYLI